MLDIKLTNGSLIDGNGTPAYTADIGIKGDKIACFGDLADVEANQTIDVSGNTICPGFIDIHTHSDTFMLTDGRAQSQVHQGVTLEVFGQCGISAAPYHHVERMQKYNPLPMLTPVTWDSFGSYLDELDRNDLGLNVASMVGHGSLRINCMETPQGHASHEEITAMEEQLDEAMQQGAVGLSFGLEYEPGYSASIEEMERLCAVVARHNGVAAIHMRDRARYYDTGLDEAISLARNTGVTMQISHINPKYGRPAQAMQRILDAVLAARKEGIEIYMDLMPVDLNHTNIISILPTWATHGSPQEIIARLEDPGLREKMKKELKPVWQIVLDEMWDKVWLLSAPNSPELVGLSFEEISRKLGHSPLDCAFDIMISEGDRLRTALWTSQSFDFGDIDIAIQDPECAIASDVFISATDGILTNIPGALHTFDWVPRAITHFTGERNTLSLEETIRRLTSVPARRMGISDRGLIQPGNFADLVVLSPETFKPCATFANLRQYPEGVAHVLCNGNFVIKNGERLENNPGRVIRG